MSATADESRKEEQEVTALADRVAVVTGASPGIGAGLAAMLAAEGARVVLAARRGEQLEAVAAGIRQAGGVAVPVVTDLADDGSLGGLLARTQAELGPVNVLVNNAGFGLWRRGRSAVMPRIFRRATL